MHAYYVCSKAVGDATRCGFYAFELDPIGEVLSAVDIKDEDVPPNCLCNTPCKLKKIYKETSPNKGKNFYSCPLPVMHPQRCDFYQLQGGPVYELMSLAPEGICCVCMKRPVCGTKKTPGDNYMRKFYRCATKTCAYFVWL